MSETDQSALSAANMVDLQRYPIENLNDPRGARFAEDCRRQFAETGLCALHDFIRPEALAVLANEARSLSDKAYFCRSTHNAYLTGDEDSAAGADVRTRQEETYVGSVAYDLIPEQAALKKLYQWDPLRDFIGKVLGKPRLYRFGDIMGACSINVFRDGGEHGWHFDESEFTVTMMLQPPEQGGAFEYVPKIRGLENERAIVASRLSSGSCVSMAVNWLMS